jgi:acetylornithine deacetylase/succinyl-diaminopimelate desuccinylase-like protein
LNSVNNARFIDDFWHHSILPSLAEYIQIPNKSPLFDENWEAHGFMDAAVALMLEWVQAQDIAGLECQVHRLPGRTPTILLTVQGQIDETVMIYGHLDKQPEFTGWDDGLAPFKPVFRDDKLYGRGGADDGYAIYSAIAAIKSLQNQGVPHPRTLILIEASEESGSPDLSYYMDKLAPQIGEASLVIALDSTCGNYDQLWVTTSLRGMLIADLTVKVLHEGVHSGAAGGIVPSSFRLLRQLISRLEDENTGVITPDFLSEQIPEFRRAEAIEAGRVLAGSFADMYPFAGEGKPLSQDPTELVLNNTWAATLAVTGLSGAPAPEEAGNVLRPETSARLSLRIPPTLNPDAAAVALNKLLTENPPNGAELKLKIHAAAGWHSPPTTPRLKASLDKASHAYFGAPAMYMGCGGSIPFMEFLVRKLPDAQFVVTGLLGPRSNAHGPNEFLHIPTAKKLTAAVAELLSNWAS